MLAADRFGNNPLHKACRFRNPKMLRQIIGMNNGNVLFSQRNMFGRLPLEMPHNDILNDKRIHRVFSEHYANEANTQVRKYIKLV